jgi:hypothetical protein
LTDGTKTKTGTISDLKQLSVTHADFKGVTYEGVTLKALHTGAGWLPDPLKAVKAVATEMPTASYAPSFRF